MFLLEIFLYQKILKNKIIPGLTSRFGVDRFLKSFDLIPTRFSIELHLSVQL